jgi:hypothetical protein
MKEFVYYVLEIFKVERFGEKSGNPTRPNGIVILQLFIGSADYYR